MNSHARNTIAERRKSCPWFFWGLDGYTRHKFPEGWTYFYENGEEGSDSLDSPQVFPWDQTQASNADSSALAKVVDKTGSYALSLSELETAIEDNEKEISVATSVRDKNKAKSEAMRTKAIRFKAESLSYTKTAATFNSKAITRSKNTVECDDSADKLDVEVATSEEILKQKKPLLEVQKLVLAARRANDSYGN